MHMISSEISAMSIHEKLKLMDVLWENLSSDPEQIVLPEWHREELEATKARREAGLEEPMSLEAARGRLFMKTDES